MAEGQVFAHAQAGRPIPRAHSGPARQRRGERGLLYTSFLVWKSDRDWLVQHLDFSTKPEVIMPWLALGGGK